MSSDERRHADLYVFCLHHHKEKETLNPLDLAQWTFYVLPTARLESIDRFKDAKTISLNSLLTLNPSKVSFNDLGPCIMNTIKEVKSA